MAKGLSDIQKRILLVVNELPGEMRHKAIYDKIKCDLFPELYKIRYSDINKVWYNTHRCLRYFGDGEKKNCARVTVSRSINRLMKRDYLNEDLRLTDKAIQFLSVNGGPKWTLLTIKS